MIWKLHFFFWEYLHSNFTPSTPGNWLICCLAEHQDQFPISLCDVLALLCTTQDRKTKYYEICQVSVMLTHGSVCASCSQDTNKRKKTRKRADKVRAYHVVLRWYPENHKSTEAENRKSTLCIVIKQVKPLVNPTTGEGIQKKRQPMYFAIDEVGSLGRTLCCFKQTL